MSARCDAECPDGGPRCEYNHCGKPADWSVWNPWGKFGGRPVFMCTSCRDAWVIAMGTPMAGIDRPPWADEDWRPSLMDHLRFARIAMEHEDRVAGRHTLNAQDQQREAMRKAFRDLRRSGFKP